MKKFSTITEIVGRITDFIYSTAIQLQSRTTGSHREIMILLFLACGLFVQAQDLITLKNGNDIDCRVTEVSETHIKYQQVKLGEQFIRVLPVEEVFMIKYESGRKEVLQHNNDAGVAGKTKQDDDDFAPGHKSFAGPRLGFTCITAGTLQDRLSARGKTPVITQFGWQFEKRLFGFKDGPSGIFEFIPLLGGMEQGLFLPSVSTLIGLRGSGDRAVEFAVGPTLSITGVSMVFALGMNFSYRNVNFPVNLAFVPSIKSMRQEYNGSNGNLTTRTVETGHRISLFVGFNVRKK